MEINVLDLFSGVGGFHLGLERAGFKVNSFFSEVDKYAIQVYKNNFKNSTYVGSVTDVRGGELPRIDAITFGSPCQDFSLAGKREGMGGDRSSLITEAIRLVSECRPRFFIWENVKGTFSSNNGADFWAIIQAFTYLGGYRLEWQLLNTSWFLPQNRERIYLVGYIGGGGGKSIFPISESYGEIDVLSRQQANTNTLTARYRADGNGSYIIERKQYAQEIRITDKRGNIKSDQENMPTIVANYHKMPSDSPYIEYREEKEVLVKSNTKKGYEVAKEGDSINLSVPNSKTRRGRVGKGQAQTLDTQCNQAVIGAARGRNPNNPSDTTKGTETEQRLEINSQGVANTLTSVTKDNLVVSKRVKQINPSKESGGKQPYQQNRVYDTEGLSPTLMKDKSDLLIKKPSKIDIRRLTPVECERLQGFPDNWTKYGTEGEISDTQRYKMCGNAVTVDVVAAVANKIYNLYDKSK